MLLTVLVGFQGQLWWEKPGHDRRTQSPHSDIGNNVARRAHFSEEFRIHTKDSNETLLVFGAGIHPDSEHLQRQKKSVPDPGKSLAEPETAVFFGFFLSKSPATTQLDFIAWVPAAGNLTRRHYT
jgi:hypothetical protein